MKIEAGFRTEDGVAAADAGVMVGLAEGTQVRTTCGWRRIEYLRPGSLVVTRDAGLQPVRLILRRTVTTAEMVADPALAPVRLMPRAVGPMMPRREVRVASGQRVLLPAHRVVGAGAGVWSLIEAREIAGASDLAQVERPRSDVTYYSLVFDSHQMIQAEGMQVESFLPTPAAICTLGEAERAQLVTRFPELGRTPSSYPPPVYVQVCARDLAAPA